MASVSERSDRSRSQYFSESQSNIVDLDNMMDNLEDNYPTQESHEIATNIPSQVQEKKFQFDIFKVHLRGSVMWMTPMMSFVIIVAKIINSKLEVSMTGLEGI